MASVEKQVYEPTLRQMLVKQLARDNANEDCRKIIEALQGDPSIEDMVTACAKVGSVKYKMSELATTMSALWLENQKCFCCGKAGHQKANCPHKNKNRGAVSSGYGNCKLFKIWKARTFCEAV